MKTQTLHKTKSYPKVAQKQPETLALIVLGNKIDRLKNIYETKRVQNIKFSLMQHWKNRLSKYYETLQNEYSEKRLILRRGF